ncbi:hydrogenase maturation nickel metallochaperone HypA [Campylobacter sp. MIT 21-1685]|uniref:hydrogenase maturation nickel metallochaperone HypA/HybF n=1 Tax=unclassified Campylobacter TaxID=2593542 RepID=UPI00224B7FF1|nr:MULTISPECIES: hydrogenase maturation nickel metallochaperone HypA [unclassified Campylobacter]MCX2682270.1 hydrogenase maturation nickel metallochaperone HypA [Campylobacter sp. MIT 21-1684]MCX2750550.1 hydrogenase maturation nickel metallochaperone HypA [Campylobacter sp. MIT 21-1682]MCX2806902.1 hydrogenase maturation nickel metallochaperone HypA [Campylobacter sp. MIT 21-1685]
MHELSIVESLIGLCEENALSHNANSVEKIFVKIGRLSGVESELFQSCFDTFKLNSKLCANAKLELELAELEIFCKACAKKSILLKNIFKCPYCESIDIEVLEGEQMYLMRLEMS